MAGKARLPMGIENFERIRKEEFYYVDKTGLIRDFLIDEYDVPLDYAYRSGYYDAMAELARILFGNAFKTNDSLKYAVLTECLRISKKVFSLALITLRYIL